MAHTEDDAAASTSETISKSAHGPVVGPGLRHRRHHAPHDETIMRSMMTTVRSRPTSVSNSKTSSSHRARATAANDEEAFESTDADARNASRETLEQTYANALGSDENAWSKQNDTLDGADERRAAALVLCRWRNLGFVDMGRDC